MEYLGTSFITHNWGKKLLALAGAIAIWLFVYQSITATKVIANVPVHLVNVPPDRTVEGLLPNGILNKRVTLEVTGTKDVVESLEPSDLEVVIDASNTPNEWNLEVTKKNLKSLNPYVDLYYHISNVQNNELPIKMSKMVTAAIPVTIAAPIGEAPPGYQYLDIWPQGFTHTVTGPEEQVKKLQEEGLYLRFDLSQITTADLDQVQPSNQSLRQDEVYFMVPDKWKQAVIPFEGDTPQLINDPLINALEISFLRKKLIPIGQEIPISIFFPTESLATLNPETVKLAQGGIIQEKEGVDLLTIPLFASEVSELFVFIVRNNLEISIIAAEDRDSLQYAIDFVNPRELEDTYFALIMNDRKTAPRLQAEGDLNKKEARLRRRFRDYMQHMRLYKAKDELLLLEPKLQEHQITVRDISVPY